MTTFGAQPAARGLGLAFALARGAFAPVLAFPFALLAGGFPPDDLSWDLAGDFSTG